MTAVPRTLPPGSRTLYLAIAALLVVAGLLAAVVLASRQTGQGEAPSPAPAFEGIPGLPFERFSVRTLNGANAVLVADAQPGQSTDRTLELDLAGASIEVLRPAGPGAIRAGDHVTVVGVQNDVQNFSIRSVVIQREATTSDDGVARSPLGFLGHEASADAAERVLLGGLVQSATGDSFVLDRGAEPVTLTLSSLAVVYELGPGSADDVAPGDRLAMLEAAGAPRLLVLPR